MTVLEERELTEWETLYESVAAKIRVLDENGCPTVRAMGESAPQKYPKLMLGALSRSYVMARWMMLSSAMKLQDIDALRVYDRFIDTPECSHRLIDPTIAILRKAGYEKVSEVIEPEHFQRYGQLSPLVRADLLGALDWSETNMDMLYVVYLTGSDENRKQIAGNLDAALEMIRERGITSTGELFHVMNATIGGSASLSSGAL